MKLSDYIQKQVISTTVIDGDKTETITKEDLGKGRCIIMPNNEAARVVGEDAKTYTYSYVVFMKKPSVLPKEGDILYITKADHSIDDKECRVKGLVTLKQWLKLWLQ